VRALCKPAPTPEVFVGAGYKKLTVMNCFKISLVKNLLVYVLQTKLCAV